MSENKEEFPVTEVCTKCPHLDGCTTKYTEDDEVEEFFKIKELKKGTEAQNG